ncbi:MAG: membrane protein insertase YidC, partial [Clostridia bacterium]|nr:membrane protein insertase YidC [Clostridia bacterium]
MKKFEAMKKLSLRLVLALLALAILGSILCGCAAQGTTSASVSLSDITFDENANSLSKEELKALSEFVVSNSEAYVAFVAAYRGYDMTEKDFDLEIERPQLEPSIEAAKNVLKKFDKDGKKLANVDYTELTVADMESVIDVLKTDVERETTRNFFETIQYWIGVALSAVTNTVGFGNYLVGICIFAILFEIVLLPLSIKQQKNSIKQAKLRPKEMAIRRKYAGRNDQPTQQKIQQEIQELYTRENFNPMGGCLPLLLQFPIILILYNIVIDPIRYTLGLSAQFSSALTAFYSTAKAAGGFGGTVASQQRGTIEILSHIKDEGIAAFEGLKDFLFIENGTECFGWLAEIESKIPSFSLGSLNFGLTPNLGQFNWLWLIPIITFAVYFGSMKLTRKFTYQATTANDAQMGCSNNVMDFMMPLMSVYISFIVPATISVYWIFKSLLGTLKQFILSRTMPLPQCTEEDIKAAEKELKGKKGHAPARATSNASGNKPRSLHHIDDDDELPPAQPKKETAKPKEEEKKAD